MEENKCLPFVSTIIVVRNEREYIEKSLMSLINQDYPKERYEIIIVDGQSTDDTVAVARKLFSTFMDHGVKINFQIIDNQKKILSSGWNLAIKAAQGEYVVRIDAHSYVGTNFISKSVEVMNKVGNAVCVGGCMKSDTIDDTGRVISYVLSSPFGVGNSKFRYSSIAEYVDTVAFGLYKKEIFNQVGYFDETLKRNQDIDFHSRIKKIGGKFYLDPSIEVTYYSRNNMKSMLKQAFGNGKWNLVLLKRNSSALSLRHLIPLIFVSGIIGLLLLSTLYSSFLKFAIYIVILHVTIGLFFARKKTKKSVEIIRMPFVFLALHLSYGIGSLVGVFHKL